MPVAARFPSDPFSVVEARQLVVAAAAGCPEPVADDAALLASELVSNAVLHAKTPFEVVVERVDGSLRVAVRDESPDPPRPQQPPDDAVGGRGLVLVSKLSSRWGFESSPAGKSVWFELDLAATG